MTATGAGLSMQRVSDWLEKLGLGQYAQRFAENDISFSILPDLTDQDLKEIGVSLGHRRELLRAIANLGKSADAAAPAPSRPVPPGAPRCFDECRHVAGQKCGRQEAPQRGRKFVPSRARL